jgi:biofilm PGA synthesis N-glycosyltransferase PgaC
MIYLFFILIFWSFIFLFIDHFSEIEQNKLPDSATEPGSISVVICARNEEENIPRCLDSILSQKHKDIREIIVVNDHSTDQTEQVIHRFSVDHADLSIRLINLTDESGKKAALRLGLTHTTGEYIYLCDADCALGPETLNQMLIRMGSKSVVFGVVLFKETDFWSRLINAENVNNLQVTQAFFGLNNAVMANGGNMLIRSEIRAVYLTSLNSAIASGDDVFFAQNLVSGSYASILSKDAAVFTDAPKSFNEFWNQRLRWASKTRYYQSYTAKFLAAIVWLMSLIFLCVLVIFLWLPHLWLWLLLFFASKALLEFSFHKKWMGKIGSQYNFLQALVISILHPLYVVSIGLASVFGKSYTWKNRVHAK